MSTIFYLPSTGAPDITPDFDAVWHKTSEADRLEMVRTKISSAFAIKTCSEDVATGPYEVLNRQYVSNPIGAHDFTGCGLRIQVRCMEDNAKADFKLSGIVKVVSGDGNTLRGYWLYWPMINEFDDVLTNRGIWITTLSAPFSSQNGDRIVVEIGTRASNTKTTLYTATQDFGDASGTNLPINEIETAQYNPWISFTHDIPEATGDEFVYAGNIPLSAIPDTPKGLLSMVYGGNIPLSPMPSYTSILDRIYAGAMPLAVLPDAPKAPLEKSYAGAVALALVPNSAYGLAIQYVYAGDVAIGILPSYASILDRIYNGDIALVILPDSPIAPLSKSYAGDIGLALIPNSIYELISGAGEFVYAGDIPLIALPSHALIMDRVYQGAVTLGILPDFPKAFLEKSYSGDLSMLVLPDFPKAILEKAYAGDISFILVPNSLYSLEEISEFLYAGNIPVSLLPYYSSMLEKAYEGDIAVLLTPSSLCLLEMQVDVSLRAKRPGMIYTKKPSSFYSKDPRFATTKFTRKGYRK